MTLIEAISAKIEPYSVSDEALELGLLDSSERFGLSVTTTTVYSAGEHLKCVSLAAMRILSNMRTLSNENIGGLSNSYSVGAINALIRSIAKAAGLSSELVGVPMEGEQVIKAVKVW